MSQNSVGRRRLYVPGTVLLAGLVTICAVVHGQEQSAIYLLAVDQQGMPMLDLKMEDIAIKEDVGPSTIVSIRRFGWPLKVTVLIDNGPRTTDALAHYRAGLKKFFAGLPPGIPVSLI